MIKENIYLGGSTVAAIGSKLCCIGPLMLGVGLGASGAAAIIEPFRPYLLGVAVLSLAYSFYSVYFRREKCADGSSCAAKTPGKTTKAFLWVTVFVVTAVTFLPFYVGYLAAAITPQNETSAFSSAENETNKTVVIDVEGMSCEGCAMTINQTLRKMKGVVSAEASFKDKNVKVVYDPKQITLDEIKQAINALGYKAK